MRHLRAAIQAVGVCCAIGCSNPEAAFDEFTVGKDGRLLLVPVKMNDVNYLFALDTGAAVNAFDVTLRSLLGGPTGTATLRTPAGDTEVERFTCPPASLGRLDLRIGGDVVCADFSGIRRATGEEI